MKQALYIQPMTARDAAFAEGRKAGLREAAEYLDAMAREKSDARLGSVYGVLRDLYRVIADELRSLAGEP